MPSSLIHGKYVICKVISRTEAHVIADGAVFQRDGTIIDIGPYQELVVKYQPEVIFGSDQHVVMPGFVNSHHHVGLTPISARVARLSSGALVRQPPGGARCTSVSGHALFGLRDARVGDHHCATPARLARRPHRARACHRRANPQGLRGRRHAGVILLTRCATRTAWSTRPMRTS